MNSKNLSKAINRMLAILLTAAMVAGSFTVPAKATETDGTDAEVVEVLETSEPGVENDSSTGEEASEEAEEALPVDEELTAAAEEITEEAEEVEGYIEADKALPATLCIGIDTAELAKIIPATFNNTAVKDTDVAPSKGIEDCIKLYTDSSKSIVSSESSNLKFTYYVKKGGATNWTKLAERTNSTTTTYDSTNAGKSVKDAGQYRIDVYYRKDAGDDDVELRDSYSFTINKVDISDWVWQADKDGTVAVTEAATAKYDVIVNPNRAEGDSYSTVERKVTGSDITNIKYTKPSSGSMKDDEAHDALDSTTFTSAEATFTVADGDGWNTLDHASVGSKTTPAEAAKLPKVTATLKDSVVNYKGVIKNVPFTIAQKADNSGAINGPTITATATEYVEVPADEGAKGSISITDLIEDTLIVDSENHKEKISKDAIADVVLKIADDTERGKLVKFFAYDAVVDGGAAKLQPRIKYNAETGKVDYETLKAGDIDVDHKEITANLTVTLKNYAGSKDIAVSFVTTQNGSKDAGTTIKNGDNTALVDGEGNLKTISIPYTGAAVKLEIRVDDSVSDAKVKTNGASQITTYFYKGQGADKKYLGSAASTTIVADGDGYTATDAMARFTIVAPDIALPADPAPAPGTRKDLVDVGDYSALIVYKGETAGSSAKQTMNFKIVKQAEKKNLAFDDVADATTNKRDFTTGKLPLIPTNGTVLGKDDIVVKIGTDVLVYGVDYTIETPNMTNVKKTWTEDAKIAEIKANEAVKAALTASELSSLTLAGVRTNTDNKYSGLIPGLFATNTDGTVITAVDHDNSNSDKVFADEPYAVIKLLSTNPRYAEADPIYVRYEITNTEAAKNTAFKDTYTVAKDNEGMTIPLTGAYTVNGTIVEPEYYTVTKTADSGSKVTGYPAADYHISPSAGLTYTSDKLALGNSITFRLTPHFAASSSVSPVSAASYIDVTVKCKDATTLTTEFGTATGLVDGTFEFDSTTTIADSNINKTLKDSSGSAVNSASYTTTTVVYRLAEETPNKNPNIYDAYTYKGKVYTCHDTATLDSDGKETETSAAVKNITAMNAGTYLFVTTLNDNTNYEAAAVAELPLIIKKKALTSTNATLKVFTTLTAVDYDTDNSASNYAKLISKDATISSVGLAIAAVSPNTLVPTTIGNDMTMSIGAMKKNATGTGYVIPVTATAKDDDKTKKNPYINNFAGSVTTNIDVNPIALTPSDFSINVKSQKFGYTGEVQKPQLLSISYKNQPYTGSTEAEILAKLKAAIDPSYFNAKLVWPGDADATPANDGKSVSTHTISLKLTDDTKLYTLGAVSATYDISKGSNADIEDATLEVVLPAKNAATTGQKVGVLPLEFESKSGKAAYKVATNNPYPASPTITGYTEKDADGKAVTASTLPTLTAAIEQGNILKLTTDEATNSKIGYSYEFEIPAKFDNYVDKNVKVKVTIKEASLNTEISTLTTGGFNSSTGLEAVFNGQNAEERLLAMTNAATLKVTQAGQPAVRFDKALTDGTIKLSWYKSTDDTIGGTYKECELEDTKNVGYYKALVTLEGATKGYYMTPDWTNPLGVKKMTDSATTTSPLAATDLEGDITYEAAGYVYTGEVQAPKATIKLKEGTLIAANTGATPPVAASPVYTLVQGKDFDFTYDSTTDGKNAGEVTATFADGNIAIASVANAKITSLKYTIAKKELTFNLEDAILPLNTKDTPAVTYDDVKGSVSGIADGEELDPTKVKLVAKDADGKTVALTDVCKKAGKYTVEVFDEFSNDLVQNSTTTTIKTGNNYKLARASKSATVTVQTPQEIAVTAEVKVGDKVVTNGKKIVKPETAAAVTAVVKDDSGKTIDSKDYAITINNAAGAEVDSVFALGKYTISIESTNDAFIFNPAKIELEIEVVETIPRVVQSVSADPEKVTLNFGKDTMKTATSTISAVFDVADETLAAADIDYSSNKVASAINVSIADGGVVTFTTTAYGDKEPIIYTFWVDGDETKTATVAVTNKPESSAPSGAEPGTPEDIPDEYEKPEDSTLDINDSGLVIKASKEYTYTGKPIQAAVKVSANPNKLVNGVDYKVTYAENVNAGTGKILVSGINQYNGLLKDGEIVFTIKPKKASGFTVVAGSISSADEDLDSIDERGVNDRISVYDGTTKLTVDEDYTIERIEKSSNGKKIDFVIKGAGNYDSNTQKKASIAIVDLKGKKDIAACEISDIEDKNYTGSAIKPDVKVTGEDGKPASYTVTYKNNKNVGVATVTIKGKGDYAGSIVTTFNIISPVVEEDDIVITVKDMTYTGKLLKPSVKVQVPVGGKLKTLSKNKDYVVYYGSELNAGTGRVIIRGIGNYAEILTDTEKTFTINKADFKKVSIKKNSLKQSGVYFNNKKLVVDEDFIVAVSGPDAKGKYTVTISVVPEDGSRNFTGSATKTIKGTSAQIDWEQLGYVLE